MDVGVTSLLPVAIRRVSGVMSSRLSSDTAGSGFRKSQVGSSIMLRTVNHPATRLAAVEVNARIKHIFCHLTPHPETLHAVQAGKESLINTCCGKWVASFELSEIMPSQDTLSTQEGTNIPLLSIFSREGFRQYLQRPQ